MEPPPENWAWFAGLFEGQGNLALHRSTPGRCRFQIKTTDEAVARLALNRIGGRVFGPYSYRYADGRRRKPFWVWVSDGISPLHVGTRIWPWLGDTKRARLRDFGLEPVLRI